MYPSPVEHLRTEHFHHRLHNSLDAAFELLVGNQINDPLLVTHSNTVDPFCCHYPFRGVFVVNVGDVNGVGKAWFRCNECFGAQGVGSFQFKVKFFLQVI